MADDLASLLSTLKNDQRVGDKRLADLANDYAGVPLLHRSTIRNWSAGTSTTARNWQQIAAIAAALRLDESAASELLLAASCEPIIDLRTNVAENDVYMLRYWPDSIDESTVESATLIASTTATTNATADNVAAPAFSERRRRQLLVIMAALAVTLSGLAFSQLFSGAQTAPPSTSSGQTGLPAIAEIRAPTHDSVVGTELVFSGTASHPNGISHVQLVLQRLDLGIYWNPDDQIWQQRFRMFVVPVETPGANETGWWYRLGDEFPLPPGPYRARVWAYASDGNDDSVGPLVEFTVAEDADMDSRRVEDALALQLNAVPDPRRQAEAAGVSIPTVRVQLPENGSSRSASAVRIRVFAEYELGLAELRVALRNVDRDRYWNFATDRWQETPAELEVTASTEGASDARLDVDLAVPESAIEPGTFEVIASAIGVDGTTFEIDEVSTFSVRAS